MKQILFLLLAFSFCFAQLGQISINNKTRQFVDQHNRTVIFHGVNIVYKIKPYLPSNETFDPQNSLTDSEIDDLVNWGFNFGILNK